MKHKVIGIKYKGLVLRPRRWLDTNESGFTIHSQNGRTLEVAEYLAFNTPLIEIVREAKDWVDRYF